MRLWRSMAALLAAAMLAAAGPAPAQDSLSADNGVAAKVNGEAISTYDLVQRMRLLVLLSGLKPDEQTVGWLQRFALTGLINDRLKTQEFARFRPLSELDGDIDDQIRAMGRGDPARVLGPLGQDGVQADSLRAYLRGQIAWANLARGRLGGRVQIGEAQAAQAAATLNDPATAKVRLTGLFLSDLSTGDRASGLAMAAQLAAQIRAGASLEGLGGAFSDMSPYTAGPDGRWMTIDSLDPEVAAAIAAAPLGALGEPIETREGVLLLVVLERYEPGGGTPPNVTAETMAGLLKEDRLASLAGRYLRDLKSSAEISP
ncbi:parvulin-like peptidyl-prolyl isomerase [Caulobacter ginsengisoli]|uniref:Parvulin-like PPIase n=1 Tax=Caulobacter ginsengisoli TaxID=400775 RepID=A0ABU0IU18_9CAUL|nr:peptidylprolyl isomerase [Caulobacter ginsengisoli]MDQ0465501.1 parvulin-like peptidyl-prolyl isomerase [Caulobacter ginsengisoli]